MISKLYFNKAIIKKKHNVKSPQMGGQWGGSFWGDNSDSS